jgi:Fe2+ or Zn2+ uptake regulation protein
MARPSHIRPALVEVLSQGDRHDWTIDALQQAVAERGVPADFSSVFRALRQLERDGAVARIDLGDGKARFEAVAEHHEHVRCERCGAVEAVPGCLVQESVVERQTGFAVTGHTVVFAGVCPRCRKRSTR